MTDRHRMHLVACIAAVLAAVGTNGGTESRGETATGGGFEIAAFDGDADGEFIGEVAFQVQDPDWPGDGYSPWVSVESPGLDISRMIDADEVVITSRTVHLVAYYPFTGSWLVTLESGDPAGFTRRRLVEEISRAYHHMYRVEEQTSTIEVIPIEERRILNRNRTDGKFGVWGHDLGDLGLKAIYVFEMTNGRTLIDLEINS